MSLTKRLLKSHTTIAISLLAGLLASSASIYFDIVEKFYLATRRLATWHLDELLLILIIIGGATLVVSVKHLKNRRIGSDRHFRLVAELHEAMAWRRRSTSQFVEELTRTKLAQMADGPTAVFIVDVDSTPAVRDVEVLHAAAESLEAIIGDGRVSYFQVYGKRTSSSASNWRPRRPFLIPPALAPDSQICSE